MKFQVTLPSGESLDILINSKEFNGISLINEVDTELNIPEDTSKYFGLYYTDKFDGGKNWIQVDDDLKSINATQCGGMIQLQFAVHVFPKHPHLLLPSGELRRLFRQDLKHLLVNDLLRCDIDTSARLDAFIAQAELGNYHLVKHNYVQRLEDLQIYAPVCVSGTPITEYQYIKKVQSRHAVLNDMRPAMADISFLNTVQNINTYGYIFYKISDATHKQHFIVLSTEGIHFVYETSIETAMSSEKRDTFPWSDMLDCKTEKKSVTMQFSISQNDRAERKFKIKSKYSYKDASRFQNDIEKYKEVHCTQCLSFAAEKTLPNRKGTPLNVQTIGGKLSTWKLSIKRIRSSKEHKGRNLVSP